MMARRVAPVPCPSPLDSVRGPSSTSAVAVRSSWMPAAGPRPANPNIGIPIGGVTVTRATPAFMSVAILSLSPLQAVSFLTRLPECSFKFEIDHVPQALDHRWPAGYENSSHLNVAICCCNEDRSAPLPAHRAGYPLGGG